MQKYPFQINSNILKLPTEISELVGGMGMFTEVARSPQLRRSNRIKTIYSSLAIEQNTLTLDQVTAANLYTVGPDYFAAVREEYSVTEPHVEFLLETAEPTATVVDRQTGHRLIYALQGVFNGAFAMSQDIALVETSSDSALSRNKTGTTRLRKPLNTCCANEVSIAGPR